MRKLMLCLLLGLAVSADAQVPRNTRPKPAEQAGDRIGTCGIWVKWVGLSFASDDMLYSTLPQSSIQVTPIEFWRGPYASRTDAQTAIIEAATLGAWGDTYVDGGHSTTYTREFFPPQRIARTRWESDCLR